VSRGRTQRFGQHAACVGGTNPLTDWSVPSVVRQAQRSEPSLIGWLKLREAETRWLLRRRRHYRAGVAATVPCVGTPGMNATQCSPRAVSMHLTRSGIAGRSGRRSAVRVHHAPQWSCSCRGACRASLSRDRWRAPSGHDIAIGSGRRNRQRRLAHAVRRQQHSVVR